MRCSGKDLITNHLTMSLYNHFFIWGEKYLPKGIFCNGWILVNGEKMSKSLGNFFTVEDFCKKYSTDASRLSLAFIGDTIENANLVLTDVENLILRLTSLEASIKELCNYYSSYR